MSEISSEAEAAKEEKEEAVTQTEETVVDTDAPQEAEKPQTDAWHEPTPEEREIAAQRARIVELEGIIEELATFKNEAARARADLYNYRTRVERDREKDRKLAAEGACTALLPVMDNLDRTLDAMDDKDSPIWKGVSMVQKQFLQALMGLGLTLVPTEGPFDPKVHEAVGTVEVDDDAMDGQIVEALNRGYRIGDKLLRASLVKVGKKK